MDSYLPDTHEAALCEVVRLRAELKEARAALRRAQEDYVNFHTRLARVYLQTRLHSCADRPEDVCLACDPNERPGDYAVERETKAKVEPQVTDAVAAYGHGGFDAQNEGQ